MKERSRPEKLAFIVGGKKKLAQICEISPTMVTRWCQRGRIDTKYNTRIKRWMVELAEAGEVKSPDKFFVEVLACLETHDVCHCCGQVIDSKRV